MDVGIIRIYGCASLLRGIIARRSRRTAGFWLRYGWNPTMVRSDRRRISAAIWPKFGESRPRCWQLQFRWISVPIRSEFNSYCVGKVVPMTPTNSPVLMVYSVDTDDDSLRPRQRRQSEMPLAHGWKNANFVFNQRIMNGHVASSHRRSHGDAHIISILKH